jgi:glycosyltransferase involved in cell wall biosynthesis
MLNILMFVNWPVYKVDKFNPHIRNPDQLVSGKPYWFFEHWPTNVNVDVVGIRKDWFLYPLESTSRIYFQHMKMLDKIKEFDCVLTFDSPSAFVFSFIKSKTDLFRKIPHIMIDVGLPDAFETIKLPKGLVQLLLKTTFNPKSISHIIFFSRCQRDFYRKVLNFSDIFLSYVPFGVESEYFIPTDKKSENYIYSAGEYRDFKTLLDVYRVHEGLPELRIRSELPKPSVLPHNVKWLPRDSISTFRDEVSRAKLVVLPLHNTLRSTGLMTCLQSMALGKPVLTSKVPPIDGYVIDGETAVYYKPYDTEDLYQKLSYLLKDDDLLQNIGIKARKAIEENYDTEKMGNRLYRSVIGVLEKSKTLA